MSKPKESHTPIMAAAKPAPVAPVIPAVEPMPATGCVICGQYGNLTGSAGNAQWHAACEAARPDLIAKAKARA